MSKLERVPDSSVNTSFDFALRKVMLPALKRRRFTSDERVMIAQALTAYFALCGWQVWHEDRVGHSIQCHPERLNHEPD